MNFPLDHEDIQARMHRLNLEAGSSNEILDAQDEHVVRSMLINERTHLSGLDQEIDRLKSILTDLQHKRESCWRAVLFA